MLNDGLERHRAGDLDGASEVYLSALEQEPENYEAMHLMALLEQDRGRLDAALDWADKAVERQPQAASFRMTRGTIRQRMGNKSGAVEDLRAAVERNANLPGAHLTLGYLEWQSGNLEEAETALRAALRSEPDSAPAMTNLGQVLLAGGRVDEAITHLQEAAEKSPGVAPIQVALGQAFMAQGAFGFAERCLANALEVNAELPGVQTLQARCMAEQGRADEAAALLQTALEQNPDDVDALVTLGDLAISQQQPGHAVKNYQFALSLDRDRPGLLTRLGDAYRQHGDADAARKCLSQALQEGDDANAATHAGLGLALIALGDANAADIALRRALTIDPKHAAAAAALGGQLFRQGEVTEAAELVERARSAGATGAELAALQAEIALSRGQFEEAIQLTQVDESDQTTDRAWLRRIRARADFEAGRVNEALQSPGDEEIIEQLPPDEAPSIAGWPARAPDDGRAALILLAGMWRSGCSDWLRAIQAHPQGTVLTDGRSRTDRHDVFAQHIALGNLDNVPEATLVLQRRRYWQSIVRRLPVMPEPDRRVVDLIPLELQVLRRARRFFPGTILLLCVRHPKQAYVDALLSGFSAADAATLACAPVGWLSTSRALDLNTVLLRHEEAADTLAPSGAIWPHLAVGGEDVRSAFREEAERRLGLAAWPHLPDNFDHSIFADQIDQLEAAAVKLGYE